ncbi:MAG: NAD(P)H-dependent oxidoreductase [Proteobacteria bacterium]|nr:NAD(P)H-dependent oxidoreductase [Pseudomonadota bacterium]
MVSARAAADQLAAPSDELRSGSLIEEDFATTHNGFAPDIQQELDKLLACEVLTLQFPLCWFSVPAILKGWFDRVFALGKAYEYTNMLDTGFLAGLRASLAAFPSSLELACPSGCTRKTLGKAEGIYEHSVHTKVAQLYPLILNIHFNSADSALVGSARRKRPRSDGLKRVDRLYSSGRYCFLLFGGELCGQSFQVLLNLSVVLDALI